MDSPQRGYLTAGIALLLFVGSSAVGQQPRGAATVQSGAAAKISFEPYTVRTFDGREHPAELGRLSVPESRASSAPSRSMIFSTHAIR